MVEIDGRQLWADVAGTGAPAVVFVPGAGSFGLDFLLVHQQVAERSTSILYDRTGTGWSDDIDLPRSAEDVTDELRSFLQSVGVPTPYLLVGHSLGGLYVRRYAQRFPDEVAGLLLLDPAHEDLDDYLPEHLKIANQSSAAAEMPPLPVEFVAQYRALFTQSFRGFPDALGEVVVDRHFSPDRLLTGLREGANVLALFEELRAGGPTPQLPLIVLSGGAIDPTQLMFAAEDQLREQIAGGRKLYDSITDGPDEHRILDDAAHATIPMVRPDAIAQAVDDLRRRVRGAEA
jgi:pimeloyl-ACP methyl ester carboxylesterase